MLIFGIIVVCFVAGYFLATNLGGSKTAGDNEDNTENISGKNENAGNEVSNEENDTSKDQKEVLQDLVEESNQFPSDYVTEGEECKTIDDTSERGDCFQAANESYLPWYINDEKDDFHFPYQRDQSHWEDVFYYSINEDDELGTLRETEYYDAYIDPMDPQSTDTDHQRGIDTVQGYWHVFSGMVPEKNRPDLKYIYWTDTDKDMVYAVGRHDEHPEDLTLSISHNFPEYDPYQKYFLIHEFGHMLTLNEEQVNIDEEVVLADDDDYEALLEESAAECDTFYTMGCMGEDSYLYAFYKQFWEDIYPDFQHIDWDDETDYEDFFFDNEERFMSSYQGTDPSEDIADAFAQFVMMNSEDIDGKAEMKYDKLQFFYEYDELVELRTRILENMFDLSVEDEVLY